MFSLVMTLAPVTTFSGTFSPLDAAQRGLDAFVAHAERILHDKRLDIAVRQELDRLVFRVKADAVHQ